MTQIDPVDPKNDMWNPDCFQRFELYSFVRVKSEIRHGFAVFLDSKTKETDSHLAGIHQVV
jgi:hypothetical protein